MNQVRAILALRSKRAGAQVSETRPVEYRWLRLAGLSLGVALLYVVTGVLGLRLAVPPGYATIIWPASGIAIAALLIFSPRLVVGVFLGSFVVNAYVGAVLGGDDDVDPRARLARFRRLLPDPVPHRDRRHRQLVAARGVRGRCCGAHFRHLFRGAGRLTAKAVR